MACHTDANHNFCTFKPPPGLNLQSNCIDCHMPAKASKIITMLANNKANLESDYIRTHLIAVYNDETKKVIKYLKKK